MARTRLLLPFATLLVLATPLAAQVGIAARVGGGLSLGAPMRLAGGRVVFEPTVGVNLGSYEDRQDSLGQRFSENSAEFTELTIGAGLYLRTTGRVSLYGGPWAGYVRSTRDSDYFSTFGGPPPAVYTVEREESLSGAAFALRLGGELDVVNGLSAGVELAWTRHSTSGDVTEVQDLGGAPTTLRYEQRRADSAFGTVVIVRWYPGRRSRQVT